MDDLEADMANLYDRECRVLPDWALSDVDLDHRATLTHRTKVIECPECSGSGTVANLQIGGHDCPRCGEVNEVK